MSFALIKTIAFVGIEAIEIEVQVHIGSGLPYFGIVGLPDKSIAEAKERIRAVFNTIGLNLPPKRITINMSPASIQKEGSHYDLPIAIGILCAMNVIHQQDVDRWLILGELSLDGSLKCVNGILIAALYASSNDYKLICPYANAPEAKIISNNIIPIKNIVEIIAFLKQGKAVPVNFDEIKLEEQQYDFDMKDIHGQDLAKQALEIAAVFNMHILLIGAPGIGKSMLAKRLVTILPPLTSKEILEINMIYSIASAVQTIKSQIPFRAPHHSTTSSALIGGGSKALPGEISLAHNGVLFLDELGEYNRSIEGLRQSMETGSVTIARNDKHITYPAKTQIIAAMNPCKCGYFGTNKECKKAPICANEYQNKISGPILDRFDLVVYMQNNDKFEIDCKTGECSESIKKRVIKAREFYQKHFEEDINILNVNKMKLNTDAEKIIYDYANSKNLNQRTFYKILKIARTIACLEQELEINIRHISKALLFKK